MSVTIKEIAAAAGVSWQTVSFVVRGKGRISEATRRKVQDAAERLGYRPNGAARAYRTGRFGCAALVLGHSDERSDLPLGLLHGIQDALARNDLHLTVARLPDAELTRSGFVPKVLRENFADGMLINYTHDIPDAMLALIEGSRAPAIWLNTNLPHDCVHPDDEAAAHRLTGHLLALGHRRIAYVKTDASPHYSTVERRSGYERAMAEAGLPLLSTDRSVPASEQTALFDAILSSPDRPTALIVRPEDIATVAYLAARRNVRIPQDLSLACIAGAAQRFAGMEVTAVIVPSDDEGAAAVAMLLAKIEAPETVLPARRIPFHFAEGETCAVPVASPRGSRVECAAPDALCRQGPGPATPDIAHVAPSCKPSCGRAGSRPAKRAEPRALNTVPPRECAPNPQHNPQEVQR